MSARSFFEPDARTRVASAVAALERRTSAEVVVALRRASGHYVHTDYLVGCVLAMASLLVFLFHPHPFSIRVFPLEMTLFFALGSIVSANLAPLRRLLTSRRLMAESVRTAARAAFVDLGVARTRDRTGILVFVSMFERRVEIVADAGVDEAALGDAYREAQGKLAASLRRADMDAFLAALAALGPPLAAALPRAADDVNELADEARA
jgi:putative membrane protein